MRFEKKIDEIKLLKKRTKAFEKAIILFNSGKIKETIDYLMKIEVITTLENIDKPEELNDYQILEFARFLFEGIGLNKNTVGDFLGENKPLSLRTNYAFFSLFQF